MVTQEVNRILRHYQSDATDIIAILQDVQRKYRYLPQDVMEYLSSKLDIPLSRIYHLATFFRAFSLEPRGKHELQVCMGTACHVRGALRILEAIERNLKIKAGETTEDMQYTLETVNCVGACALGPVVVVDGKSKGKLNPQRAERLLKQIEPGEAEPPGKEAGSPPADKGKKKAGAAGKKVAARKAARTTKTAAEARKKGKAGQAASSKATAAGAGRKPAAKGKAKKGTAKKAKR